MVQVIKGYHHPVENSCIGLQPSHYICNSLVPGYSGVKREDRCKSGAIPVAVNPIPLKGIQKPDSFATVEQREGHQVGVSQKTCQINNNIQLSGERREM